MYKGKLFLVSAYGKSFIDVNEPDGEDIFQDVEQEIQSEEIHITYILYFG